MTKTPPAAINAGIVLMRLSGKRDALDNKRDALEDQIHRQVLEVLKLGGTWTTVSAALGVSRQAAHERYRIRPAKYRA